MKTYTRNTDKSSLKIPLAASAAGLYIYTYSMPMRWFHIFIDYDNIRRLVPVVYFYGEFASFISLVAAVVRSLRLNQSVQPSSEIRHPISSDHAPATTSPAETSPRPTILDNGQRVCDQFYGMRQENKQRCIGYNCVCC